jgi:hypothetical protein
MRKAAGILVVVLSDMLAGCDSSSAKWARSLRLAPGLVRIVVPVRSTHMSNGFFARAVVVSLLGLVGMSLGCDKSPAGPTPLTAPSSPPLTAPSSATVLSVAVNGSTDFTSIGQTVQLTATATFSDGARQNVSATATWQALSVGATVTSGGLVTAMTSGTVTIRATYQGRSGEAFVQISPATPSRGSMTAAIDGASWVASYVWATKIGANSAFPSGRLNILGTNGFTGQYEEVVVTVPAVVGTYSSDALDAGAWIPAAAGEDWDGVRGTVTLATLTASEATGTFSFTVMGKGVPLTVVTNGVFNVTF